MPNAFTKHAAASAVPAARISAIRIAAERASSLFGCAKYLATIPADD